MYLDRTLSRRSIQGAALRHGEADAAVAAGDKRRLSRQAEGI